RPAAGAAGRCARAPASAAGRGTGRAARLPPWRRAPAHRVESQRPPPRPAGQGFRPPGAARDLAPGVGCAAHAGSRGAHRPAGALAGRCGGTRPALQPAAAERAHRHRQRPGPLRALHERAGGVAVTKSAATPLDARSFDLVAFGLAAVLALHAPHLPWWLGVTLASILGLRWWQRRRQRARTPAWLKLPLLAALLLSIVSWYGNLFGQAPGAALAVGLLVLKLLETETARDARVGMSFACFTLMAALLFDQSLTATTTVALGLLPPLAALRSLEPGRRAPAALWRELLPGLGLLAVLLLPRLNSPLWGAPNTGEQRTGLSDRMTPAGFTRLLVDDSPALRV